MLGSFAVGKTSLVQRFANSIFSEKYQTTIGVKIDQKMVSVDGKDVNLLLWDIHGEDDYQKVNPSYLIGSSGCFIVIDGTRKTSLDIGMKLISMVKKATPEAVVMILINKTDIKHDWDIYDKDINEFHNLGFEVIHTSAKTNDKVDHAFTRIAELMLKN